MQASRRIGARHYYDMLPAAAHRCGDIWTGLPTNGLLGLAPVSGIIVTPACDLSQNKAETVTYLPIVPVLSYFSTLAALPDVRERTLGQIAATKAPIELQPPAGRYSPFSIDRIDAAASAIGAYLAERQRSEKETVSLTRASAGLAVLRRIADPEVSCVPAQDLAALYGSEWSKLKLKIARNALSSDLHFLPSDEQNPLFSGIPRHSVALFRYPITAPLEVFDLALEIDDARWAPVISRRAVTFPAALSFKNKRPVKALSMHSEFLADLLSRYVSIYNRLGSPDFTPESLSRLSQEMEQ